MRRRPVTALAVALVVTLTLSGCVSWFLPPAANTTSTPTGEDVAPELEPFYTQILSWSNCDGGMQCSTAEAPLDWSDPSGDSIELALVRQPTTSSDRIGSLLVNPGGPGGSGYDFVKDSVDYATDDKLQSRFDIVGFDPRGVNRSTPVTCYTDPAELDEYIYGILPGMPGSDEWIAAATASTTAFGNRCLELTGPLLGNVDTPSAARDLDMLRAILGDTTLNYLGFSYGTLLGQVYAELFPDKTGRLVLDGAVDPASDDFEGTATQAQGFESALRAFLKDCDSAKDCPFTGSVDSSLTTIRALLDSLDVSPIANDDGRQLGSSAMFTAIILPLYNAGNWGSLRELFSTVFEGDASFAFQLADAYNGRDANGEYDSNQTEAFISINCLDAHGGGDVAQMRSEAAELKKLAPVFGPQMSWGGTGCPNWPVPSKRDRAPIVAPGSADILVVGTTNDPATPYSWAETVANTLENGHLVTYDGEGHTAYNKSNDCVNKAVDDFLIDGTVPATDPQC
ncbi:alpha/beta hydrolase [Salinibacterium sp. G-O1]|uniref:alpha/beta hydrolase n=1 Tax=Salinibacterium sp. G-O1 TaxID=3046208 RepID=UPI0024B969E5|nr:alpha/beta hydrolase [Salinibacterium sp. G-O1]MDJ0334275.1 alpha/beta hydrolase [Salinibacterium sp. G-O1]